MQIMGNFYIGKIQEQYYAFYAMPEMGGVIYSIASPPFHTVEDAHHFLIEKAKSQSTDTFKITCVDMIQQYMFIGDEIVQPEKEEDGA